MAVTSASSVQVHSHNTPAGPAKDSSNNEVHCCYLSFILTGTYAQADNSIISGVPTLIQNMRRDGRAVTLLAQGLAFAAPGKEDGAIVGVKTLAVSSNDITFEVTQADLSTEHANAAFGAFDLPITIFVAYKLAAVS